MLNHFPMFTATNAPPTSFATMISLNAGLNASSLWATHHLRLQSRLWTRYDHRNMSAVALGECLRDWDQGDLNGLAHQFQKRLAKVIEIPLAHGDWRRPALSRHTKGDRPDL